MSENKESFMVSLLALIFNIAFLLCFLIQMKDPLVLLPFSLSASTWIFRVGNLRTAMFGGIFAGILIVIEIVLSTTAKLCVDNYRFCFLPNSVLYHETVTIPYWAVAIVLFLSMLVLYIGDLYISYRYLGIKEKSNNHSGGGTSRPGDTAICVVMQFPDRPVQRMRGRLRQFIQQIKNFAN